MTSPAAVDAVTGGFSFTGGFIRRELIGHGRRVRTLTNHPGRWEPADGVEVLPLRFRRDDLLKALEGVDVFYNTYWVRFPRAGASFEQAVADIALLAACAREAGVRRFVHVSVSNPSADSPLGYYAGKARAEAAVRESGVSWAIVRPTLIFGDHDILLNNLAWLLRRLPGFLIPGSGGYRVQPVSGEDVARLCRQAAEAGQVVWDAAGPEVLSYRGLVERLARAVGRRPRIMGAPPGLVLAAGALIGRARGDVLLTREELDGLMQELLVSAEPPRCADRLDGWLERAAPRLGLGYASEVERHFAGLAPVR